LTVTPTSPQANQVTTFRVTPTVATGHSIVRYDWIFGDGTTATTTSPATTKTYTNIGTYIVTVTATDDLGQIGVISASVTIGSSATASFTASPTNPVPGQSVHFNASASTGNAGASITKYAWDFGDGGTEESSSATASHTYSSAGTYVIHLVVTDSNGLTGRTTATVTVAEPD
jgi:chitinase